MLPNYLHVGQPKAGSTTLHFMLVDHPDVCLVRSKEAHFFDSDQSYRKGLEFYTATYFSHCGEHKVVGDITPAYALPAALERIGRDMPKSTRISVCFRFPVARTYSHYCHDIRLMGSLDALLMRAPLSVALAEHRNYTLLSRGARILEALLAAFPRENILPLIFERDMVGEGQARTYRRVCDFLGIPPSETFSVKLEGKGFLPNIVFADEDGYAEDFRGRHDFQRGDIVIETLQEATYYRADVISRPDAETRGFYETLFTDITTRVSNEEIRAIHATYFAEDTARLKRLLDDDIPEWDLDGKELTLPIPLESRISAKSRIVRPAAATQQERS